MKWRVLIPELNALPEMVVGLFVLPAGAAITDFGFDLERASFYAIIESKERPLLADGVNGAVEEFERE